MADQQLYLVTVRDKDRHRLVIVRAGGASFAEVLVVARFRQVYRHAISAPPPAQADAVPINLDEDGQFWLPSRYGPA